MGKPKVINFQNGLYLEHKIGTNYINGIVLYIKLYKHITWEVDKGEIYISILVMKHTRHEANIASIPITNLLSNL